MNSTEHNGKRSPVKGKLLSIGEPPRRRPQLSEETASYLRDLIMAGELLPGTFLRNEQVAHDLGVSATPVREALMILRGEGFVDLEPRRGFIVARLSNQDIRDVYWAHAVIAGELAAKASVRLTTESLGQLKSMQRELGKAYETSNNTLIEEINFAFHRAINQAGDSPKLVRFVGALARYAPRRFWGRIPGWADASASEHVAILDGLQERDPEASAIAMKGHIQHAGEMLADHLRRLPRMAGEEVLTWKG